MKIIHCADIHLGSNMKTHLPEERADERRSELRAAFVRLLDEASRIGAQAVILAGDVFDCDHPVRRDREFFFNALRQKPEIRFFYLRGNHDASGLVPEGIENLFLFSADAWTTYTFDGVSVSGIELTRENSRSLYSTMPRPDSAVNIAVLHGQVAESPAQMVICPKKFRGQGFDYLALGHVHAYAENYLDERDPAGGKYCYCGCLEGRGFDEPGEHGYVLIDTDEKTATGELFTRFIPFAKRKINEYTVDVSGAENAFRAACLADEAADCPPQDMARVILRGNVSFDNEGLAREVAARMEGKCWCISVKDRTRRRIRPEDYLGDLSLRGEFIRTVMGDANLTEEEKENVISVGLRVLSGRGSEV